MNTVLLLPTTEAIDKALHVLAYLKAKMPDVSLDNIFHLLYEADEKHILRYGRTVAQIVYEALPFYPYSKVLHEFLQENELPALDTDELSASDIACLQETIEARKYKNLEEKSNYQKVLRKVGLYQTISPLDIAWAGGANEELLKYIRENIENQFLTF
jgi:hypothetical protein